MSWLQKFFGTIERDKEASQDSTANQNVIIDPKVAEYFKDFPDPYREKVVQRYSKREGIYQLDFFRVSLKLNVIKQMEKKSSQHLIHSFFTSQLNYFLVEVEEKDQAMLNERKMVERGIFKQDQIELEHKLKEIEEHEREVREKERIQQNLEREIPEWEKTLQQYIPLQAGDTMARKLYQTINLSLIGASMIWVALSVKKKKPSKLKLYSHVASGVIGCVCSQMIAVSRLMDLGFFDKSSDSRDVIVKYLDEMQEASRLIQNYLKNLDSQKSSER